jgi:hypothetical protein
MKPRSRWVIAGTLLIGACALAYAFTVQPAVEKYVGSGAGSKEVIYLLDGNGNLTIDGGLTVNGKVASTVDGSFSFAGTPFTSSGQTVYTPFTAPALSSFSVINPIATLLVVQSTGANINMAGNVSNTPAVVATATAVNGQWLILESTNPTGLGGTVTVSSGTSAALHLGAATRVIGCNAVLVLIYNSVLSMWNEVSYTGN